MADAVRIVPMMSMKTDYAEQKTPDELHGSGIRLNHIAADTQEMPEMTERYRVTKVRRSALAPQWYHDKMKPRKYRESRTVRGLFGIGRLEAAMRRDWPMRGRGKLRREN